MKLLLLLYLEQDGPTVTKLLTSQGIDAYSRVNIEGQGGEKAQGVFGGRAPHASKMIFAVVTGEQGESLRQALREAEVQDANHPIHVAQLGLEAWESSEG
jgi:hypothetical protein